MGTMFYGDDSTALHFEDRALAHLKVVIATKLRRGESFTISWVHGPGEQRGRSTVWISPSIPLRFVFDDPEPTTLNPRYLDQLATSANSSGGIQLIDEDPVP
ncbi:MAG: hypothetical protein QM626_13855 [Microbacterium sp.]|uniref:DUF7882 family protein n=1 Tax=Microbacterium sp. TaxID=51671 RepID=UPI0039E37BCD